jgi:membrane associated rhomboid family serine protease
MGRGITEGVKHLLIVNVIMFVGMMAIGNGQLFNDLFALYFPKNPLFQPWQILTHMFMHSNVQFAHILFNMFALWMFGTAVEQVFGLKKFLIFYILSGLGAACVQIAVLYFQFNSGLEGLLAAGYEQSQIIQVLSEGKWMPDWENVLGGSTQNFLSAFAAPMVGASGAIMGVLVAFGMLFPESKLMLIFLPVPIKAKYFIPAIIGLDLFSALTGTSIFSPGNTAYAAHLGGALTGFLMMWVWKKNETDKYRWN